MYWRVRKISPEELLKTYAVHILLAASVLVNGFLILTRPQKEKMSEQTKLDMTTFAKTVTNHLLDTSYINYMESTTSLNQELHPKALQKLKNMGVLPATMADLKGNLYEYNKTRRVCAVKFRNISMNDPDPNGFVPVHVFGTVAVHSSDESAQHPFHMKYMLGLRAAEPHTPIVLDVEEGAISEEQQAPQ